MESKSGAITDIALQITHSFSEKLTALVYVINTK